MSGKRARGWIARSRIVLYALLLAVVGYHAWRYELVRLPAEGCSPLGEFAPGTRLVIDRAGPTPTIGDAVLYRAPEGILLGRVSRSPADAGEGRARPGAGASSPAGTGSALWILKDRRDCPGSDSRQLGALPVEALLGRVAGTLPW